jgi:nucleoside-diphosphate-sugar epimerase
VLSAALDAGARRVVITSSVAAVQNTRERPQGILTEADWTEPDKPGLTPYPRSKTIAERAAWELVERRGERERLAAVNPGAIIGPLRGEGRSYSLEVIERLLSGMPGVPRIGWSFVDVRDVADLHVLAMTDPRAGGERFIAVDRFLWLSEVAEILRRQLGDGAEKVPTRRIPNLVVRGLGVFDPGIRAISGQLGKHVELSSEKARSMLGWSPRPLEESIVDCARSLLEHEAARPAAA